MNNRTTNVSRVLSKQQDWDNVRKVSSKANAKSTVKFHSGDQMLILDPACPCKRTF